ncbi:MAG: hypothetical protein ACFUZC_21655 [Chthoniobacteraceae bacterium]
MKDSLPTGGKLGVKASIKRYFQKRTRTRLMIWGVFGFTGAVGFSVSYTLLYFGVGAMWIRYPLAVLVGYVVFLGLIRMWVEWERDRYEAQRQARIEPEFLDEKLPSKPYKPSGSSSWLDGLDFFDLPSGLFTEPEGCLAVLGVLAVVAGAAVLVMSLLNAEALIAEGFVDTFLVLGLYRRMRKAAREHWLGGMVRRTWALAVVAAMVLGFGGYLLQQHAPGAKSIGPAVQVLLRGK